jgi:hypothetical protein
VFFFFVFVFGGGFSSWSYNFWFIGHQTMDEVQKYALTNANTQSSETYRSDLTTFIIF